MALARIQGLVIYTRISEALFAVPKQYWRKQYGSTIRQTSPGSLFCSAFFSQKKARTLSVKSLFVDTLISEYNSIADWLYTT